MIDTPTLKRRFILISFVGVVVTGILLIGLAGFGKIPPEPVLGIIGLLSGSVILLTSAWRWSRRSR